MPLIRSGPPRINSVLIKSQWITNLITGLIPYVEVVLTVQQGDYTGFVQQVVGNLDTIVELPTRLGIVSLFNFQLLDYLVFKCLRVSKFSCVYWQLAFLEVFIAQTPCFQVFL